MKRFLAIPLLLLSACGTPAMLGSPKLQVQIPTTCEELAAQVALPKPQPDAAVTAAEQRGAAVRANKNLGATRNCQVRQRERFAKGK